MMNMWDRSAALFEVLFVALIGPIVASALLSPWGPEAVAGSTPVLFAFLMIDAATTIAVIVVLLRLDGHKLRDLGLETASVAGELMRGVALAPLLFGAVWTVSALLRWTRPDWISDSNPLLDRITTPDAALLLLVSSLSAGAFREEIQRAFVLRRFARGLGGAWVGLPLWSAVFGLMHLSQGPDRAVAAFFLGLILGGVYLKRRHLGAPITAHALFNAAVIGLAYAGFR